MQDFGLIEIVQLDTSKLFTPERINKIVKEEEKTDFPTELLPLVQFMAVDSEYRLTKAYLDQNRLFIQGETLPKKENNEFVLRANSNTQGFDDALVITTVSFVHRRCGNMTNLYKLLKSYQMYYETGPIIIENVMSEEMIQWCNKNGFREIEHYMYIEPDFGNSMHI